ncbi:MAG: diguanylate cyclase [Aquincola sp.]|nr:diguanylate cyclase [Aquincola sp.]
MKRGLVVANLLAAALLAGLVLSVLLRTKSSHEARARDLAESLAAVAQLNIGSELAQVDAVLKSSLQELAATRDRLDDQALNRLLRDRAGLLPAVEDLHLSDTRGHMRWGRGLADVSAPGLADAHGHTHATAAELAHGSAPILSGPERSPLTGQWVMVVSRPLMVRGRFQGMLCATISADHVARLFARYELGLHDAITLRTDDLRMVARRAPGVPNQGDVGMAAVSSQLREATQRQPDGGWFVSRAAIDNLPRTTAYRRVEGWPLTVFAGVSNERFFQPWREQAVQVAGTAVLAWLLLLAATVAIFRFGAREALAMDQVAAHARAQREAQERETRLLKEQAAMLDNDLVSMARVSGRAIRWCNVALERLLGYGPGELIDQSMRVLYADEASFERTGREAYPLLQAGSSYRTQVPMRRKNGEVIWVEITGTRLADDSSFWMAVDVTAAKAAHERLLHVAHHDPLTQLPNRTLLLERLRHSLALRSRSGAGLAVCYLDLDGFKAVNDRFGHDAGDALLVAVARRMQGQLRPSDTVARIGGDEFVLVLAELAPADWRPLLDRLVEAVRQPVALGDGRAVQVGASVGVVAAAAEADPHTLLGLADQALLRAKREGKGRVVLA